jgi:predicted AlkP superfamily pyrophosphatase or phosphodiesterase
MTLHRTVVINVVGLTATMIGEATPNIAALAKPVARITPPTPAVTCTSQATFLTGENPSEHGIVGNGWYFRELDEVWLWRQSNRLIESEKIWDVARRRDPAFTCSNTFWWYAMATGADVTLTPRPLYCADGVKLPDLYAYPDALRHDLNAKHGTFPLFEFWGPRTTINASDWIAKAAIEVEARYAPTLNLVYLPHLDYVLQREGPEADLDHDLAEVDAVVGRLVDHFAERGVRIVLLSEYGIMPVNRPVHPNRLLRDAGLIELKVDLGLEYLDTGMSRAFAVADHQIAHVYIRNANDVAQVREVFEGVPGIARVLDGEGKRELGLDHRRAGDLVLLAEADSWFSYYFWHDDARAPDYARMIDIHKKPGYDPVELFIDPQIRFPTLKVASILARKALGFRYKMEVTPLDASLVKGSHGIVTGDDRHTPILLSSEPRLLERDTLEATEVRDLILAHVFAD